MIFTTPLYFGLAHLHHAWEVYVGGGRTQKALKEGALSAGECFPLSLETSLSLKRSS